MIEPPQTMSPAPTVAGRREERGSVVIWTLAVCVAMGLFGLAVTDGWRAISAWRRLAAAADAAAVAGASGIDEDTFRDSGGDIVQLDPALAEQLAYESLGRQDDRDEITAGTAMATIETVTVEITGQVDLPILGLLRGGEPIEMTVTAAADPRPSG